MEKGNKIDSLLRFFLMSVGITIGILVPVIIVGLYYPIIRDWWNENSLNGLWILVPSALILLRWLYKIIIQKRSKE